MMILFAGKLGVPVESVQHGIEGLMFLMTESSKHMVTNSNCLLKCQKNNHSFSMLQCDKKSGIIVFIGFLTKTVFINGYGVV